MRVHTDATATLVISEWSTPIWFSEFSSARIPQTSYALITATMTSFMVSGGSARASRTRVRYSASGTMAPTTSLGWTHSAASHVSL